MDPQLQRMRAEIAARRTFAIISHPDAGKTTLTEKLLLYGGALHLAGSVKRKGGGRAVTSDWMDIERQRGISVSSSVLQFEYAGRRMNLLDTPGHNDFSEDTYRTLSAADTAIMLIDCVKGVEPQTIKLFQVCRMRGIPIVTFINKMDRVGKDPFDLMDEIETVLGVPCSPANWPLGQGTAFVGVHDRWAGKLLRFERQDGGGARQVPMTEIDWDDPELAEALGPTALARTREEVELLETAGNPFDPERFRSGQVTPVFFGSAMNNFGLEPFLDQFVDLAQSPRTRTTSIGPLEADNPNFSGFVFKIQANMPVMRTPPAGAARPGPAAPPARRRDRGRSAGARDRSWPPACETPPGPGTRRSGRPSGPRSTPPRAGPPRCRPSAPARWGPAPPSRWSAGPAAARSPPARSAAPPPARAPTGTPGPRRGRRPGPLPAAGSARAR
jgi:peptide chain release factor 3